MITVRSRWGKHDWTCLYLRVTLSVNRQEHDVCHYLHVTRLTTINTLVVIHFWHAPLGVCSTKRRHQSLEWTILSHVSCFIQGEVIGFQVLLDSLHPRSTKASWWSPPVLQWGKLLRLGMCFNWHSCNVAKQGHSACTIGERGGCLVVHFNSSFHGGNWVEPGVLPKR